MGPRHLYFFKLLGAFMCSPVGTLAWMLVEDLSSFLAEHLQDYRPVVPVTAADRSSVMCSWPDG